MVHFGSIPEYAFSRVNRWTGLLGLIDLGWEIVGKVGDSSFFSGHKFNRCSCENVYINILGIRIQLDIKHIVRNRTCQVWHKYRNYSIFSIFLSDLGRMAGGRGSEESCYPIPPTDSFP